MQLTYYDRGRAKNKLKHYRGAIADYTKAIELNPEYAEAYFYRGLAKLNIGQINSGCVDFSKAGELGFSKADKFIRKYCNKNR